LMTIKDKAAGGSVNDTTSQIVFLLEHDVVSVTYVS
jgi:hypothetical protein